MALCIIKLFVCGEASKGEMGVVRLKRTACAQYLDKRDKNKEARNKEEYIRDRMGLGGRLRDCMFSMERMWSVRLFIGNRY